MNVAHCIHGLGLGGAQQIIKFIVRGSDRQTFRHFVYSCDDGVFRGEIESAGATVRIIPRRIAKLDPWWVLALARAMRKDEIDIVHTYLFGDSLHGYLAAQAAGRIPVVMSLHTNLSSQSRLQQLGYRWLVRRVARTVACSDSVRGSFEDAMRPRAVSIQVIPNGIEPVIVQRGNISDLKQTLGIDPHVNVIGTIGRLAPEKGYQFLIDAVARLSKSHVENFRLVLVGDGPLRAQLERQARRQGIDHLVIFAGFRPDVSALLGAFDIVAFSSICEALPVALLEAMAAGRCIVATSAPGIIDAVSDQREALLAPPQDPGALAQELARALADPALRRQLGEAAQRRYLAEFKAEGMVARYEQLYREVCVAAKGIAASSVSAPVVEG